MTSFLTSSPPPAPSTPQPAPRLGSAVFGDEFWGLAGDGAFGAEAGAGGASDFGVGGDFFYAQKFISVDKSY